MKTTHNTAPRQPFRRFVRQLFSNWVKRQHRNHLEEIFEKLQDIEDSIETIAREIGRRIKSGR